MSNRDEKRFYDYIEYLKNNDCYRNPLEILNMGENSISQFLAGLLNVNKNRLHYNFCKNFLELLPVDLNENQKNELAENMFAEQDTNNIDILLVSHYTVNGTKRGFTCVIENKKRAKLSTSRIKGSEKRQLQIEKYTQQIDEIYKNKIKKDKEKSGIENTALKDFDKFFVYLCAEKNDTADKTIEEGLRDIGKITKELRNSLIFNGLEYNEFKDRTVLWALKQLNYTIIEHRDVVMILYNILKNSPEASFENNILKPIDEVQAFNMVKEIKELYQSENAKNAVNEILENKLENYGKYIRYNKGIKTKKGNIRIRSNAKLHFYDYFKEKDNIELLCRYVEYWEMHEGYGGLSDNIDASTKIVDGKYIWEVCKDLSQNKEYWKNKKEEIKEEIKNENLNTLDTLIKYIDRDNILEAAEKITGDKNNTFYKKTEKSLNKIEKLNDNNFNKIRKELLDYLQKRLAEYVPPSEDLDKRRSISPSFNYDEHDLEGEVWKPFPLDTKYTVSNMGRIKYEGKIQKQKDEKVQYVTLADDNLRKDYVYNFVAYTFLGKTEGDGMHVHHITNDGYYNTVDNLILLTQDEHSYVHGFKTGG